MSLKTEAWHLASILDINLCAAIKHTHQIEMFTYQNMFDFIIRDGWEIPAMLIGNIQMSSGIKIQTFRSIRKGSLFRYLSMMTYVVTYYRIC